jgi:GTPase SAR1 family protein
MARIGFCGTVSVGKTTLVNALRELPEFEKYEFRTERSKYLRDLGIPLNTDSTLKGQTIFLAERCSELFNEDILTDRTIIDVIAFTNLAKSITIHEGDQFEAYASKFIKEYDYIFYIPPTGIELEDNGIRTIDPIYRYKIDSQIQKIINKYSYLFQNPVNTIYGSTEERVFQIQKILFR